MEMTRKTEMSLLAAGAYWDIRRNADYDKEERDVSNHAPIPEGWQSLPEQISNSGKDSSSWSGAGFSARAYQHIGANEVVIIGDATIEASQTNYFFSSRQHASKKQQLV